MGFRDRKQAGQLLAGGLSAYRHKPNAIVLALPRGGVPVGLEVARELDLPFDVLLVRKLGVPWHEELAMGAISHGNQIVLNDDVIFNLNIPDHLIDKEMQLESEELGRRNREYRQGRDAPNLRNKEVILVDDGLATGASMRAAIAVVRRQQPASVIVALPVAPADVYETLSGANKVICLQTPEPFFSVGTHYQDFPQLTDEEVKTLLNQEMVLRNA